MCRYVSSHMRVILGYPVFSESRIRKEYMDSPQRETMDSPKDMMNWFVQKKREEAGCYVEMNDGFEE